MIRKMGVADLIRIVAPGDHEPRLDLRPTIAGIALPPSVCPMSSAVPVIAIVDDDSGVRRALSRLLSSMLYEPVAFSSGEAFLASLTERRPGCVVMDLHLQGLNGVEVLARLRGRGRAPPVIVMTGFDEMGTRERCLAAVAVDYITKPIESADLSAAISRALSMM
jgi:FixJ family two-component response regulator